MRRYLLAGLLVCGVCGRRMESALVQRQARLPVPARAHQRGHIGPVPAEERLCPRGPLLPQLPAVHLLLTGPAERARRRTRRGADVGAPASPGEVIGYLRENEITLT